MSVAKEVNSTKHQYLPLSVFYLCLFEKVNNKQEVCLLLYFLGQTGVVNNVDTSSLRAP